MQVLRQDGATADSLAKAEGHILAQLLRQRTGLLPALLKHLKLLTEQKQVPVAFCAFITKNPIAFDMNSATVLVIPTACKIYVVTCELLAEIAE